MAIGLGIVLIVAGLILVLDVINVDTTAVDTETLGLILVLDVINVDTTAVDTETLGWILLVAGALAVVISLIVTQQRTRSTHVVERRDDRPPL